MDTRVPERNRDIFERQLISARVEADRHRGADGKTRQQIIVGIRPGIAAARARRFVSDKLMPAGNNLLPKAAGIAADDHVSCSIVALYTHNLDQGLTIPANAFR